MALDAFDIGVSSALIVIVVLRQLPSGMHGAYERNKRLEESYDDFFRRPSVSASRYGHFALAAAMAILTLGSVLGYLKTSMLQHLAISFGMYGITFGLMYWRLSIVHENDS
jgi:hypothetical protein